MFRVVSPPIIRSTNNCIYSIWYWSTVVATCSYRGGDETQWFIHYLVCRSGPFDTLIMFTTTIKVSNMYSTNIVVINPII